LGDEVLLCPAHGAGSVCGSAIADRLWTTVGLERKHNPRLQVKDRDQFAVAVGQLLGTPPYFTHVERLNVDGAPLLAPFRTPPPLTPMQFKELAKTHKVLDLREVAAFGHAHIPGSLSMYEKILSNFTGWFLPPEEPVLLVPDGNEIDAAVRQLARLGFDHVAGVLKGGMYAWLTAGLESETIPVISAKELLQRMAEEVVCFLDVRREAEKGAGNRLEAPQVLDIVLSDVVRRAEEVPDDRTVYVFCRTSQRAMLGASLLKSLGHDNLVVVAGGAMAWFAIF
jgi:hydroxyacylglutathione hydrolase